MSKNRSFSTPHSVWDVLGEAGAERLEELVTTASGSGRGLPAELKADPGQVSLETLLREVDKLAGVKALQLPPGLFADCSERLVEAWRARASRSYPSDLAAAAAPVRLTLLAALCWSRSAEITDALVDLLLGLVHKINARAERRVEKELTEDLRRVRGKEGILFRLAQAAVDHPDDTVRDAIWRLLTRFLPTARHPITTLPPGTASGVPGLAGKRQGADVVDRCR